MQKRLDEDKIAMLQKLSEENRSALIGSTLTGWQVFIVIFLHIFTIMACYAFDILI